MESLHQLGTTPNTQSLLEGKNKHEINMNDSLSGGLNNIEQLWAYFIYHYEHNSIVRNWT